MIAIKSFLGTRKHFPEMDVKAFGSANNKILEDGGNPEQGTAE